MYCSACGTALAPGLSFCNRCGMGLKETVKSNWHVPAFLTAITLIGICGLGIMLGGALALTKDAGIKEELVGFFMLFVFLITLVTEVLLLRQLSRLTSAATKIIEAPGHVAPAVEFRSPPPRSLAEPPQSVTENTTRTLEYSGRDQTN